MTSKQKQSKLNQTKGRFVTLAVSRSRDGVTNYSAKVQSVTDKTVLFLDTNSKQVLRVPLANVSIVARRSKSSV